MKDVAIMVDFILGLTHQNPRASQCLKAGKIHAVENTSKVEIDMCKTTRVILDLKNVVVSDRSLRVLFIQEAALRSLQFGL